VIGPFQRLVPSNTQHSEEITDEETDVHAPAGSNPQSKHANGRRSSPYTARRPGSGFLPCSGLKQYSSGRSFTASLCDSSECLIVICVRKSEFGVRKDYGREFVQKCRWYESRGPPVQGIHSQP